MDILDHVGGGVKEVEAIVNTLSIDTQVQKTGNLLVAPQLGPQSNFRPDFGSDFSNFMSDISTGLKNKLNSTASIFDTADIILTGHSGAFRVIQNVLASSVSNNRIKGVILFDALYDLESEYAQWIQSRTANTFFVNLSIDGSTSNGAKNLIKILKQNGLTVTNQLPSSIGNNQRIFISWKGNHCQFLKNGFIKGKMPGSLPLQEILGRL